MKKTSKKIKALILAIILSIISIAFIIINGNTYTVKVKNSTQIKSIEELDIKVENENVAKIVDTNVEDDFVKIKLKSISEGKTYVDINYKTNDYSTLFSIYVHKFGIITYNEYMGNCNGNIILAISFIIFLSYVLYLFITAYRESVKENLYQYKNIAYLGIIILIIFATITQLIALSNYTGIIETVNVILNLFSVAIFLLPIAFVVSILIIFSNISLIRKEGFNIRNILGIILGAMLCFATILPDMLYNILYSATWIDIHNQNGFGVYLYNFVETMIYLSITYVECILIGTIIIGFKSARRIPSFDKDYIIILGCQIKKMVRLLTY